MSKKKKQKPEITPEAAKAVAKFLLGRMNAKKILTSPLVNKLMDKAADDIDNDKVKDFAKSKHGKEMMIGSILNAFGVTEVIIEKETECYTCGKKCMCKQVTVGSGTMSNPRMEVYLCPEHETGW